MIKIATITQAIIVGWAHYACHGSKFLLLIMGTKFLFLILRWDTYHTYVIGVTKEKSEVREVT